VVDPGRGDRHGSTTTLPTMSWADRAAERSPTVQRSRTRSREQAQRVVAAARKLVEEKGGSFTTQEVVKEAGVALQTFYRHFPGKDQLLLAVIEDLIAENVTLYEERARDIPDPVDRLRFYVTAAMSGIDTDQDRSAGPRFITAEHWRLHQLFPEEMTHATQHFTDLVLREVRAAAADGSLAPFDAEHDAWLVTELIMAVFHHHAFATTTRSTGEIAEQVWNFCLAGLGGRPGPSA
jgi:AcrR family transcriptional regulator